jgi:hypothetical protein
MEQWLAIRGPAQLRQYFKEYPPRLLPDLFQRITAPEVRYLQEACELKDDVLYRTWVLLAKNVPATIEKLRKQRLDPVEAVAAVALPRRKALFLVLYAIDTHEFLKNLAHGRESVSRKLDSLTKRQNTIERYASAIVKETAGDPRWNELRGELDKFILHHTKQNLVDYREQVSDIKRADDMPHHNTDRQKTRAQQRRPYIPSEVYLAAWAIAKLFAEKGEENYRAATIQLLANGGIRLQKNNFNRWISGRTAAEAGTM